MTKCTKCDAAALTADPGTEMCRAHLMEVQDMGYTLNNEGALVGTPDADDPPVVDVDVDDPKRTPRTTKRTPRTNKGDSSK